jgi:effector-binding domain-containing protein
MTVAAVIHTGPSDMAPGWVAINEWVQRNGYRIVGPFREIFLHETIDGDPDEYAYELQFPVEKRANRETST